MASVLIPKYSLGQINSNFFQRSQGTTLSQFVSDNFVDANGNISNANPKTLKNKQINDLINSILADYGNGTISIGLQSLQLINTNVITGQQNKGDIFGNYIIYGYNIDFSKVTIEQGRIIVIENLNMTQLVNLVPTSMQNDYYSLIDKMVNDIKSGQFEMTNYSIGLLRQSKNIAQAASRIINATNI